MYTGAYRVDPETEPAFIERKTLGQPDQACLRRRVGEVVRIGHPCADRRDLDDAPAQGVLNELSGFLHNDSLTVTGRSIGENNAEAPCYDTSVIASVDDRLCPPEAEPPFCSVTWPPRAP